MMNTFKTVDGELRRSGLRNVQKTKMEKLKMRKKMRAPRIRIKD